ncbi:hypothetical protein E4U42_002560 [Claviceps africana]|uniref:Uncharacterized protein n=1 Tax=Claviceps africana TaxID=83212 RepID=A0A8K0NJN2_9HYPO|nr:hypothetical protein E4U42_002560 [Claviceps africana]
MKFSTPTVLAAVAIYAGQTLADCSIYPPPHLQIYSRVSCVPSKDGLSQRCDSIGASTTILPGGFSVASGTTNMEAVVYCGPPAINNTGTPTYCSPHSTGEFNFKCDKPISLVVYTECSTC